MTLIIAPRRRAIQTNHKLPMSDRHTDRSEDNGLPERLGTCYVGAFRDFALCLLELFITNVGHKCIIPAEQFNEQHKKLP